MEMKQSRLGPLNILKQRLTAILPLINTQTVYFLKAYQHLRLLRKLRCFNGEKDILGVVYKSVMESVLTFNILSWFISLTVKIKNRLSGVIKLAGNIIGKQQIPLSDLYIMAVKRKASPITLDIFHPLHDSFQVLPSGRRYKVPLVKKAKYKKSFIPTAIEIGS